MVCHHCSTMPSIVFTGNIIRRRSRLTGQIVEYHETYTEKICNHVDSPPTVDAVKNRGNQEIVNQGVDGWVEKVTIVQTLTHDTVCFKSYLATGGGTATSGLHGQIEYLIAAVVLAFFLAIGVVVLYYAWTNTMNKGQAMLEKGYDSFGRLQERFWDEIGNIYDKIENLTASLKSRFWLVSDRCPQGFAPISEYPTWESVPESVKQVFNEYVKTCQGFSPPVTKKCEEWITQAECEAAGCSWYDNACHSTPQGGCTSGADCPQNYKCINGKCVPKTCSDYKTQADCEDVGCSWYNGACHSKPLSGPLGIWNFPIVSYILTFLETFRKE